MAEYELRHKTGQYGSTIVAKGDSLKEIAEKIAANEPGVEGAHGD